MPDDAKEPTVEEVKDRRGQVVRRITTKPVPMLTRRKVYRTIIIAPDGTEESVQERVVERQEPDAPEQPAPKEEVPKKEEVVVVPMEVAAEESLPYEPVEVVDEDGRVQEVEEEVPVTEAEERPAEVLELVDREVAEPSKPEEPEQKEVVPKPEEVVVPMEVATEESLPYEPEQPSYPAVEEPEEPVEEDGRVVRKTITVRKRIVRRIIRLPDGTKQEVEEEVPVEEAEERPAEVFELVEGEIREPGKPEEPQFVAVPSQPDSRVDFVPLKEPRQVERVYVTRILRQTDGTERVLETSETVSPMQPEPEDEVEEREKVEEVKDRLGRVKKTIHRSPAFVIRKKKVTKDSRRILPHGKEEPEKTTAVEPEETQEVEAPVIRRVVKLVTRDSDGKEEVVEKTVTVKPFEIIESKEDGEPKVTEKREGDNVVQYICRSVTETVLRKAVKFVINDADGNRTGPVMEEINVPVPSSDMTIFPDEIKGLFPSSTHGDAVLSHTFADKRFELEHEEDSHGVTIRKVCVKPLRTLTKRRIFRTIILAPDGTEESAQERIEESSERERDEPSSSVKMYDHIFGDYVKSSVSLEDKQPEDSIVIEEERFKMPRLIERVYVTRILLHPDGVEQMLEKSETVAPLKSIPEDDEPEHVEEEKDDDGRTVRKITVIPSFICHKKTQSKRGRVLADGNECLIEAVALEPEETSEIVAPVIKRIVKPASREPDRSSGVFDEAEYIEPFAVFETKEIEKPEAVDVTEDGEPVKVITRKVSSVLKERMVKRIGHTPAGRQDEPEEHVVFKHVEPVGYKVVPRKAVRDDGTESTEDVIVYYWPKDVLTPTVEHKKHGEGDDLKKFVTKPLPVITAKKVYRTIIVEPDGREKSVQERVVDQVRPGRPKEDAPGSGFPEEDILPEESPSQEQLPEEESRFPSSSVEGRSVTVTRRTVKRIVKKVKRVVILPDGTRKEIEEEIPVSVEEGSFDFAMPEEAVRRYAPKEIQRIYETKILRERNGSERVVETTEMAAPIFEEDEDQPKESVDEIKDKKGKVVKKIITNPVFVDREMVTERTYKLDSDGDEHLMSTKVVSPEVRKDSKSKRVKPLSLDKRKTKEPSVLRKVERAKDGRELGVIEEVFRKPIEPVSWKFVKKVVAQPDGTTKEIEEPEYVLPDDAKETVDEVKDKKGKVLKRVIVKPVPMITGRKIFRTVIVSPTGAELKCTEDIEDTDQPLEEKPLGEKLSEEKPLGEKPFGEKPSEEKPLGEKPSEGKPSGEKPLGEKPSEEKPLGEKPSEGKLLDEKPSEEIIREPHPMDDSVEQIPDEYPRFIIRGGRKFHAVSSTAPEKPSPVTAEQIHRKPKHVERLYTTLLLRPLSGEDRVLETSEAVLSLEPEEESPGTTEDVKDKRGSLVKKVSTTP
eukprot:gene6571-7314_t